MTTHNTARVYVGTYGKYASGSIAGAWVNLEEFAGDKAGFLEKCAEIHADEKDPELMFQAFEGFPREFYSESSLPDALFDWLQLDENDRELVSAYADAFGFAPDEIIFSEAQDCFAGRASTEAEFTENYVREIGDLPENLPAWMEYAIDWEAAWNSSFRFDFATGQAEKNGELFFFCNH